MDFDLFKDLNLNILGEKALELVENIFDEKELIELLRVFYDGLDKDLKFDDCTDNFVKETLIPLLVKFVTKK